MTTNDLKIRTKNFSISIIDLVEKLPNSIAGKNIANQTIELSAEREVIENLFLK